MRGHRKVLCMMLEHATTLQGFLMQETCHLRVTTEEDAK